MRDPHKLVNPKLTRYIMVDMDTEERLHFDITLREVIKAQIYAIRMLRFECNIQQQTTEWERKEYHYLSHRMICAEYLLHLLWEFKKGKFIVPNKGE